MPKGKGYNDYDSSGKKKSIAKKMMNSTFIPKKSNENRGTGRPGKAPSTIAGRTARTAPVKKAGGGSSTVKPRKKSTGSVGPLAGRSPAMSPDKKSVAGRGADDRAKTKARKTRSGDMDRARRSKDADKAALKKRLRTKGGGRMAQQSYRKRDEATARNRRYKDDRALRD